MQAASACVNEMQLVTSCVDVPLDEHVMPLQVQGVLQ